MGLRVEQNGRSYDEGVAAGEIAQRLKGHDNHFAEINGSIRDSAAAVTELKLELHDGLALLVSEVRELRTEASNRDATVIATAAAVEKDAKTRRDTLASKDDDSARRWSGPQRYILMILSVMLIVSTFLAIYANTRGR